MEAPVHTDLETRFLTRSSGGNGDSGSGFPWNKEGGIINTLRGFLLARPSRITPEEKQLLGNVERLDYDDTINEPHMKEHCTRPRNATRNEAIARWAITSIIGFLTGVTAFFIVFVARKVGEWKFETVADSLAKDSRFVTFLKYTSINVSLALCASLLVVFVEPSAAGSGIPEVKAYLNGSRWRRFLRLRTYLVKVVGVMCSISGGLFIGKEGPMVHTGSCLAMKISNDLPKWLGINSRLLMQFRNDRDRRDFVSEGAAAGVSAAFGAPVGGILFSLEEASSFWSPTLTWRAFFCSMISTFTLNFFLTGLEGKWGNFNVPGLITFGVTSQSGYKIPELIPFMLIGCVGGLMGALFNGVNVKFTKWRMKHVIPRRHIRVIEVVLISLLTTMVSFLLPLAFSCHDCSSVTGIKPGPGIDTCVPPDDETRELIRFTCPEGEYNEMATMLFTTQEQGIKHLFSRRTNNEFTPFALVSAFLLYFSMAMVTYGVAVPSGLFVPSIMAGTFCGRLMGQAMQSIFPHYSGIDNGTYALIGAAAMLGGCTRMTISLTVILLEVTNDIQFLLPIMLAIMLAKYIGDRFNGPLYDTHVKLKYIPILEPELKEDIPITIRASNVMTHDLCVLREDESVANIMETLRHTTHNGFPVVDATAGRTRCLKGLMLRHTLLVMLHNRVFKPLIDSPSPPVLHTDAFRHISKNRFFIEHVTLSPGDEAKYMDLRPYMNQCPYYVEETLPLVRTYNLFRGLGLRHLPVVDARKDVVGIITAKDLLEEVVEELCENERDGVHLEEKW